MTLPNNIAPSPLPLFPVTGVPSGIPGGNTIADLAGRTQEAIQAILAAEVQASTNWNAATAAVWGTLRRGISLLQAAFEAFLQQITGSDATYESLEAVLAAANSFFSGQWTALSNLGTAIAQFVENAGADTLAALGTAVANLITGYANLLTALYGAESIASQILVSAIPTGIPTPYIQGVFGPNDLASTLQAFAKSLQTGLNQAGGDAEASLAVITNQLGQLVAYLGWSPTSSAPAPSSVAGIAAGVAASVAQRAISNPSFMGLDPSAAVTIPLASVPTATGGGPTTIPVTASAIAIGHIGIPDAGIKESIMWIGSYTGTLTGLYLNLYKVNTATGADELIYTSPNYLPFVSAEMSWNYFNLPDADDLDAAQGDWYGVELQPVGSGTYNLVGVSHWQGDLPHPTAFPKSIGATRGAGAPASIPDPTPSTNIPFFALCGSAGVSEHPPETTEFAASAVYEVPEWMVKGDQFDIVGLGDGGGAAGGELTTEGNGGAPGGWVTATLTYGVDIPLSTTEFTITIGPGGAAGGSGGGSGGDGAGTAIEIPGYGTLSAAAGVGGVGQNVGAWGGGSPGTHVFNDVPYVGGAAQGAPAAGGNAPGGGGGGGESAGWHGPPTPGGPGAPGGAWITAYRSSTVALSGSVIRPTVPTAVAAALVPVLRFKAVPPAAVAGAASVGAPVLRIKLPVAVAVAAAAAAVPVLRSKLAAPKALAGATATAPTLKNRLPVVKGAAAAYAAAPSLRHKAAPPKATAAASTSTPTVRERLALSVVAHAAASTPTPTITTRANSPTFDTASSGSVNTSYDDSGLFSTSWHQNISGDELFVAMAYSISFADGEPTRTVTCGSSPMTSLGVMGLQSADISDGNGEFIELFALADPPTGRQTIEATLDFTELDFASPSFVGGVSASYFNVSSVGSPATAQVTNSPWTDSTLSVSSATGHLVIEVVMFGAGGGVSLASYNKNNRANSGSSGYGWLIGDAAGASTVNFDAAFSPNSVYSVALGVDLTP